MFRPANLSRGWKAEGAGDGCRAAEAAVGTSRLSDSVSGFHYGCCDAGQDGTCITGCRVRRFARLRLLLKRLTPLSGSAAPACLRCATQMCAPASWRGTAGKKMKRTKRKHRRDVDCELFCQQVQKFALENVKELMWESFSY